MKIFGGGLMLKLAKIKGQSTIEYIILVTAVIAVAISFLCTQKSLFQVRLNNSMDMLSQQMTVAANRMVNAM